MPMATSPEFYFGSAAASPYTSAPSSPFSGDPSNYLHQYTSAPVSPARVSAVFSQLSTWQIQAADFSGFRELPSPEITTADRLFDRGWIRPLQMRVQGGEGERGRRRTSLESRESRSLSPKRDHGYDFPKNAISSPSCAAASGKEPAKQAKGGGSRKWRLKDLLLFRSASEGRATGRGSRDPLRKYTRLPSFSLSGRRKEGGENKRTAAPATAAAPSAHEMHYTANRAATEEQRKRTPLPYQRHGLLGFLQFSPAARGLNRKI
ncbi:hypothetical protein AXF42_Ash004035 [Apostasia shenzhenica]|uniref:Uncharacterized protein n=1 Tax=Apostasia shenzhenica TaxID=1088818 RepID=A0A2I0A1T0_9ASPA|nr:hypothetical protein AXF42_Ash004035 [Apostasia shenzhenica]